MISLRIFDSYKGCKSPAQYEVLVIKKNDCLLFVLGASKVFTSECYRVGETASFGNYPQFSTTYNHSTRGQIHNVHSYII